MAVTGFDRESLRGGAPIDVIQDALDRDILSRGDRTEGALNAGDLALIETRLTRRHNELLVFMQIVLSTGALALAFIAVAYSQGDAVSLGAALGVVYLLSSSFVSVVFLRRLKRVRWLLAQTEERARTMQEKLTRDLTFWDRLCGFFRSW